MGSLPQPRLILILSLLLAGRDAGPLTLILAGVAVNTLALALVSLLLNLAPSPYAVQEIALWMLGSLANISRNELWVMLPGTLIGWFLIWRQGHDLDLLTLGEETARSMGVALAKLRSPSQSCLRDYHQTDRTTPWAWFRSSLAAPGTTKQ
jgi:iron complex transport system permease protein